MYDELARDLHQRVRSLLSITDTDTEVEHHQKVRRVECEARDRARGSCLLEATAAREVLPLGN